MNERSFLAAWMKDEERIRHVKKRGRNRVVIFFCLFVFVGTYRISLVLGEQKILLAAAAEIMLTYCRGCVGWVQNFQESGCGEAVETGGKHKRCYSNWSNNSNRLLV